jgi:hypothetical protein
MLMLQVAHVNGYITSFEHSSSKLGVVHSFYGDITLALRSIFFHLTTNLWINLALGTLAVHLLVTNFPGVVRPSLWYLISVGIAMINAASGLFVFGFRTQDGE